MWCIRVYNVDWARGAGMSGAERCGESLSRGEVATAWMGDNGMDRELDHVKG